MHIQPFLSGRSATHKNSNKPAFGILHSPYQSLQSKAKKPPFTKRVQHWGFDTQTAAGRIAIVKAYKLTNATLEKQELHLKKAIYTIRQEASTGLIHVSVQNVSAPMLSHRSNNLVDVSVVIDPRGKGYVDTYEIHTGNRGRAGYL